MNNGIRKILNKVYISERLRSYMSEKATKEWRDRTIAQALSDIENLLPSEEEIHKYLVTELSDEVITSRVMDVFKSLAHSIHTLIKEKMGI